jgi:hypothetical protein
VAELLEPRSYLSGVSFATPVPVDQMTGADEREVITADFNADNSPDLAVLRGNLIDVLLNNGHGTFTLKQTLTAGRQAGIIRAADLGDGHVDLLVSNVADGTLDIFTGNGDGTFDPTPQVLTFGTAQASGFSGVVEATDSFVVTNLTADGEPDIVVADGVDNQLVTFVNQGTGTFTTGQTIPTDFANSAIVAQSNAGGTAAGVVTGGDPTSLSFFANTSGTLASTPTQLPLNVGSGTFVGSGKLVVGDFNGDGIPDLASTINARSGGQSYVSVLLGNSDGTFQAAKLTAVSNYSASLAVGDFNGDGKQDLLLGTNDNSTIDVLTGKSDGTFTDQGLSLEKGLGDGEEIAVADFNGDGKEDFVSAPGSGAVYLFANEPAAPPPAVTSTALVFSQDPATAGTSVQFTATVSSASGTPTGSVEFLDSNIDLGTVPLTAGRAIFSDASLTPGTHDITAEYIGSSQFTSSTSPVVFEIIGSGVSSEMSSLVPALGKTSLPSVLVSGAKLKATASVSVSNEGVGVAAGGFKVVLYASPSQTYDPSTATQIGEVDRSEKIKKGDTLKLHAKLAIPSLPAGSYYLLARVTDASGNSNTVASSTTTTVVSPLVDLSDTIRKSSASVKPGKKLKGTIDVFNHGHITASGSLDIELELSPNSDGSEPKPLTIIPKAIHLKAGKSLAFHVSAAVSSTEPAGRYYLIAVVDPSNTLNESDTTNNTAVSSTATRV